MQVLPTAYQTGAITCVGSCCTYIYQCFATNCTITSLRWFRKF